MPTTPEQLASLYQANLAQGLRFGAVAFEGAQQLLRLNLDTSRRWWGDWASASQTAPDPRDGPAWLALGWRSDAAEPLAQWNRAAVDIVQAMQARWQEVVEEGDAGALQGVFVGLFDDAIRAWSNVPERS